MTETMNTNLDLKKINRTKIYRYLYEKSGASKQDIVRDLNLSLPTVTQRLSELQEDGFVESTGSIGNTGGRRAKAFSVVKDVKVAVGVEIGVHHITAAIVNLKGDVMYVHTAPICFENSDAYCRKIGDTVNDVIALSQTERSKVLGVGIGIPALVTEDGSHIFFGKILDFDGLSIKSFERYIDYPVHLYNDAKAAGFAELWNRKDLDNAFYILLGDHVGGALIINNRVDYGKNTHAGEFGHMTIVPHGKKCYCGQMGCVDPYCSATVLSEWTGGNLAEFFERLKAQDAEITQVWNEYLYCLSIAVSNAFMLLDCPVILGGYLGAYLVDVIDEIREKVDARNPFSEDKDQIQPCQYKTEAIAAGAALPFIDSFLDTI